ncbi:MAG: hypothetical protein AAFY37_11880, partial [Pseudomonadota bacterium]
LVRFGKRWQARTSFFVANVRYEPTSTDAAMATNGCFWIWAPWFSFSSLLAERDLGTMTFNEVRVRSALEKAWSLDTAQQWSQENPANGQCNVTSAVIHDLFGGEVLRTRIETIWHYYNQMDGKRCDLTDSQFTRPGARFAAPNPYEDQLTDRHAAMQGIPQREYDTLRKALIDELSK